MAQSRCEKMLREPGRSTPSQCKRMGLPVKNPDMQRVTYWCAQHTPGGVVRVPATPSELTETEPRVHVVERGHVTCPTCKGQGSVPGTEGP